MSSIASMPCRAATIAGCLLSAARSTAVAHVRCSMYKLPIAKATAANPIAKSANAARSSRTKYTWSAATTPRNHHIHFRLLSLFFIFLPPQTPLATTLVGQLRCSYLTAHPELWMRGPGRKVQSSPPHLSHLTLRGPQKRWYTRYIFKSKRFS